jgi:hypothetical protein
MLMWMATMGNVTSEIKKVQRAVKSGFDIAFAEPLKKEWKGEDPVSGFDEKGVFSEANWNDARVNLLRRFFAGFFHDGISNEVVFVGDLEVGHIWQDDQNYVFIRNAATNDVYYATWYKSRGRTELILHNGQKITLENFKRLMLELLNPVHEIVE